MFSILFFVSGLLAWFISTVAAGGAATLLIPLITFLLSAQVVAPVISVAALIANPSRAYLFRHHVDWKVIHYMLPGSIIGAVIGAWFLTRMNAQLIQIILGLFLISYVLQDKFSKTSLSIKVKLIWFFPLGFSISFLSGLIGATGPVHNPFMLSYGLEKERLVGTKAINSFIMQLTKLISYSVFGALSIQIVEYGLALGAGAVFGIFLAKKHLENIDTVQFRQYTHLIMLCCGSLMLLNVFSN
ncbi:MAG: sulfite exporter TauE/SafE family protein [Proteobacteria bacterium]|nr:sulfite exporter TauE/SafE family protein [Pseudomonadota bacterium]NOG60797.1 sulfite exporter TauE/SafE family protein [Pseudomonadota bacterium]